MGDNISISYCGINSVEMAHLCFVCYDETGDDSTKPFCPAVIVYGVTGGHDRKKKKIPFILAELSIV